MKTVEMNVDIGLEEMTLGELINMMADNRAFTATLECSCFNIHVAIEPKNEEDDPKQAEDDYED